MTIKVVYVRIPIDRHSVQPMGIVRVEPVAVFKKAAVVVRVPVARSGEILRATMRGIGDHEDHIGPATEDAMAPIRILQVDAFTNQPFSGNPAAVCLLDKARDDAWMQSVAAEMNLSETAFLVPRDDGFDLRWFTPEVEVDLCGHATLASAHALWATGLVASDQAVHFHSRSGLLVCTHRDGRIEMDFPATPVNEIAPMDDLCGALGVEPEFVGESMFDKLLVVASEDDLRAIEPDMALLREIPARGVIVTSESAKPAFDFVSRYFAPAAGVDEDPVTGSAHCALGPYWSERLGKSAMTGFQASKRGGVVQVRVHGDRVVLGGQAVTVLDGFLSA